MTSFIGVHFTDGPCAGKYQVLNVYGAQPATTKCGGRTYYLTYGQNNTASASVQSTAGASQALGHEAMRGWEEIRRVVNKTLPHELHAADVYLRRALRDLRRVSLH